MSNKRNKVSVIGAGNVGSTCAFMLVANSVSDVYLHDKFSDLAQAKALDIGQAAVALESSSQVVAAGSISDLAESNVVVITAGIPRKPGMTRQELIEINGSIARDLAVDIRENAPEAVVIVVSNPLDLLTWIVLKETGFDRRQVFGMAGFVDNSRLRYFAAQKAKVSAKQVKSHVLGLHADQMVIIEEQMQVDSKPATSQLDEIAIEEVKNSTRNAGAQIVGLLKNGSAYYLPGTSAYLMAKAVVQDTGEVFDTCTYLEGEYGLTDVCLGVPVRIGTGGITEVLPIEISQSSQEDLQENAKLFKEQLELISI